MISANGHGQNYCCLPSDRAIKKIRGDEIVPYSLFPCPSVPAQAPELHDNTLSTTLSVKFRMMTMLGYGFLHEMR